MPDYCTGNEVNKIVENSFKISTESVISNVTFSVKLNF